MSDRISELERRLAAVEGEDEGLGEVNDVGADHGSNANGADGGSAATVDMTGVRASEQPDVLQMIVAFLEMLTDFVKRAQGQASSV
jgi:hypothetical protein